MPIITIAGTPIDFPNSGRSPNWASAVIQFAQATADTLFDGIDGPDTATDNAIVRFDGITGKIAQNSTVTIADTTGAMAFTAATGAHLTWSTNGAGNIGTSLAAGSPANIYATTSILSPYFSTGAASVATSGHLRFANAQTISWMNAAGLAALPLTVNSSDQLTYNGAILSSGSALTANRAMITGAGGLPAVATTTNTQVDYLSAATGTTGTTSTNLVFSASPTFSGTVTLPSGSVSTTAWTFGASTFGGSGAVTLTNATASTNTTSGALILTGGAGIGGNVHVGGRMGVGSTGTTSTGLYMPSPMGDNLLGVDQYGIMAEPIFLSAAATTSVQGIATRIRASGVTTMASGSAFHVAQASHTSNTITRLINYRGVAQTTGTNNAFISDNLTFSGNWFINQSGTQASTLGGPLTLTDSTASTNNSTGALIVTGGIGVTGAVNANGALNTNSSFSVGTTSTLTGNVGIGGASQSYAGLRIYRANVNQADNLGINIDLGGGSTITSNGTYYHRGIQYASNSTPISSGVTNSGDFMGGNFYGFRQTSADAGTLSVLTAIGGNIGHYSSVNATAVTTNAYGVRINPYYEAGTITNLYGFYINAASTGGTATNKWGIYITPTDFANYLGGRTGIGIAPAAGVGLLVGPTNLANANQYGIYSQLTSSSAATTATYGVVGGATTAAAAYTTGNRTQFYAPDVAKGAGSTITYDTAFGGAFPTQGTTGNIFLSDTAGPGGSYGIYLATTNPSKFAGGTASTSTTTGQAIITGGLGVSGAIYAGSFIADNFAIGTAPITTVGYLAANSALTGVDQAGFFSSFASTSAATTSTIGFSANATTAASAYTSALRAGYVSNNATKGAGSTITRDIALYMIQPSQGSHNAVLSDNLTFTGTHFIYQTGNITSRFAGVVTFANTSSPSVTCAGRIDGVNALFTAEVEAIGALISRDEVKLTGSGAGISILEGADNRMGVATLVGGTVTVSNTSVTANSRIFLTAQNNSGTPGSVSISARVAATSFTILSTNGADTSDIAWLIVEPL